MSNPLLTAIACLAVATSASGQRADYLARISGHQQVPSVASRAEASVQIRISNDSVFVFAGDTMTLTTPINDEIGAHIHTGYTGENGPVVLALPYENIRSVTRAYQARLTDTVLVLSQGAVDSLRATMDAGRNYINVHTLNYPGGEVRGQLFSGFGAGLQSGYDAMLYGDDENPAVLTEGMGGVIIEVRADTMYLSGSFTLESPLSPVGMTGAHIHSGSFGENGGILLALNPRFDASTLRGEFRRDENAFPVDDEVINAFAARGAYVNIHSEAHPSGEIRGQIVTFGTNLYKSHVSYSAPSPFPKPEAYLRLLMEKSFGTNRTVYSGAYSGWDDEIATDSLRPVAALSNPFVGGSFTGAFIGTVQTATDGSAGRVGPSALSDLTEAQLEGVFLRYGTFAQWRTPDQDVVYRQRFYHECKRAFHSEFTASQEVPATPSAAGGTIVTEYYGDRVDMTGLISGLGTAIDETVSGGFHIHDGIAGRNGDIVAPVDFLTANAAGTAAAIIPNTAQVNLNRELAARMKERGFYYNIHTTGYPMGEIRAQILPQSNTVVHALAEPAQARPGGVVTDATGALLVELYNGRMTASGSFEELQGYLPMAAMGSGSHLHAGIPGMTGPVIYSLNTAAAQGDASGVFAAADNTFDVSSTALDSLTDRAFYLNIHSDAAPSGEIRGQAGPLANNQVHARLGTEVTKPYTGDVTMGMGMGNVHGELYDTTIVHHGSFSALRTDIDTSIAGGAHVHIGKVAETGGILLPLNLELPDGPRDTAAMVLPDSNTFELLSAQTGAVTFGGLYVNVHTDSAQSGAIRGQVLLSTNQYPEVVEDFVFPTDGASVDLDDGELADEAVIDWEDATDPDSEHATSVAYIWQLFTDTTAAPVVQTEIATESQTVFTFGALDTLLTSLGVDSGATVVVHHRAWTTDGSLLTPGEFNEVSFTRRGTLVGTTELAPGSVSLLNTAGADELLLDVTALPAGVLRYDLVSAAGQSLRSAPLQHDGNAQRYTVSTGDLSAGMYFLHLRDEAGAARAWGFLVR